MADWFKIPSHFIDSPKMRYCVTKQPLSITVLVWCFSECCRARSDRFQWTNSDCELEGLGLVLCVNPDTIRSALQILTAAGLIGFEDGVLVVRCWQDHQSEYLNRKSYHAERYQKQKVSTQSTVEPVEHSKDCGTGGVNAEDRRTEERRTEETNTLPVSVPPARRGRKPKDLAECLAMASRIGLDEPAARQWFIDCEACEWKRGDGTPFDLWTRQMCIHRDNLRGNQGEKTRGATNGAQLILWQTELKRVEDRMGSIRGSYGDHQDWDQKDRDLFKELKARKTQLVQLLGMKL